MVRFLSKEIIERIALGDFARYKDSIGSYTTVPFPLKPEDIFKKLFGLTTYYLDFEEIGLHHKGEEELLGALYPDGCKFEGQEKLILVNNKVFTIGNITADLYPEEMQRFTVFHEGGHYALHVRSQLTQTSLFPNGSNYHLINGKPPMCRTNHISGKQYEPKEFQANRYAAAFMMPSMEVFKFFNKETFVNLDIHADRFKKYFGVSQMAMEKRLFELGYRYTNGKYDHIFKKGG